MVRMRFGWVGASVLVGLATMGIAAAPVVAQDEDWSDTFPDDAGAAYKLYEEQVPLDKWIDGPVEYLVLDYEKKIWNDLQTDVERAAFRKWFWNRRDIDEREEENPFRTDFYKRVASANQRFHGYPNGWRSDRGRVWIILGPPTGGLRRTDLGGYGRCSAESGEWWTYYTQGMAFNASFGEFHVIFVESRVGHYEICDPVMLGLGGWPTELRRALEYTAEAAVVDAVTEFDASGRVHRAAETDPSFVRELKKGTDALIVPADLWGKTGVGGAAVVPVVMPLRDLLFEPGETTLSAKLTVEAALVGLGESAGRGGRQEWKLELDNDAAQAIAGSSLRTALVLPAAPGGYSIRVRITDPLSGRAWVWDGETEIRADGSAVSPPLVGMNLARLREGGEVAVLSPDLPVIEPGRPFYAVSWVRGTVPDPSAVSVSLRAADGSSIPVDGKALWGDSSAAGPLIYQATVQGLSPGTYTLRMSVAADLEPVQTRVQVR